MPNMLFEANEWLSHPDRILAVVGGAAVGGFGLPWLVQMAVRGWTGQQIPRWIMMTLRVGMGGISGWLVMLWLFAGGGGGMGGPGGFGFGSGNNNGENKPVETAKNQEEPVHHEDDVTQTETTLVVEVLGEKALQRIAGENVDKDSCYRVEMPGGSRLMTLKEVEEHIKHRAAEKPPLNGVKLVLYNDSPSKYVSKVAQLAADVSVISSGVGSERLSVAVVTSKKAGPAPSK